jgi:phosphomannomutase
MPDPRLMISVSGIRGRVGSGLTPEVVARYAAAFGAWAVGRGRADGGSASPGASRADGGGVTAGTRRAVVLGRDSRVTGPLFHTVTRAALESVGADVIDIGLTTTPSLQLAVEHHHAAGGICISASHNPIEWNALKFIGPDGLFLSAAQGGEMRALVDAGVNHATWDALGATHYDGDAIARHLDRVLALPFIDIDGIRSRKFVVAYDARPVPDRPVRGERSSQASLCYRSKFQSITASSRIALLPTTSFTRNRWPSGIGE